MSHYFLERPFYFYEQGFILLPHLATLGLVNTLGIYHSIFGFGFNWIDRYRITSILGAHLGLIGSGSLVFILEESMILGLQVEVMLDC